MLGDFGEPFGDFARHLGRDLRGVELVRIEPDQAKPFADFLVAKVFQENAIALPIRELGVVLPLSAEVGVNLEAMADVADDQKWRPALRGRQRFRVILGLPAGAHHQDVPGARRRALAAGQIVRFDRGEQVALLGNRLRGAGPVTLLGLQNEAAALVEIDPARSLRAVGLTKCHRAFEGVGVGFSFARGLFRSRRAQNIAEFGQEERVICPFLSAIAGGPTRDEGFEVGGVLFV